MWLAESGCFVLFPLIICIGAPGFVLSAGALSTLAAVLFAPSASRRRVAALGAVLFAIPAAAQLMDVAPFDVAATKGHQGDKVLFSKWNSFSRIAVYDRTHGEWSLSPRF